MLALAQFRVLPKPRQAPWTPLLSHKPRPPAQPAIPGHHSGPSAPAVSCGSEFQDCGPADTTIPMILENTINTKSAYVGQAIYCESIYPITVGNHIIIPKGSSIRGTVTEVIRPGRVKGRAQIGLRFDELILPNGTTRHLRATLAGFGSEGDDKFKPKEGQDRRGRVQRKRRGNRGADHDPRR